MPKNRSRNFPEEQVGSGDGIIYMILAQTKKKTLKLLTALDFLFLTILIFNFEVAAIDIRSTIKF